MKRGGTGGASTLTGLIYEAKVDLGTFLDAQKGYTVEDTKIYFNGELVARLFKKHSLYKYLKENEIDWTKHIYNGCFQIILSLLLVTLLY